jgi:hypothetical protein
MDSVNEESAETETDNRAVDLSNPDTVHRAKMTASVDNALKEPFLTLVCSCGTELAAGFAEMEYQAIHRAAHEHGQAVMEARMEEALGPLLRLFGML